jgi:hypothetical protein
LATPPQKLGSDILRARMLEGYKARRPEKAKAIKAGKIELLEFAEFIGLLELVGSISSIRSVRFIEYRGLSVCWLAWGLGARGCPSGILRLLPEFHGVKVLGSEADLVFLVKRAMGPYPEPHVNVLINEVRGTISHAYRHLVYFELFVPSGPDQFCSQRRVGRILCEHLELLSGISFDLFRQVVKELFEIIGSL